MINKLLKKGVKSGAIRNTAQLNQLIDIYSYFKFKQKMAT